MLDWTTLSLSNSENNELLKHMQNVIVLTFIAWKLTTNLTNLCQTAYVSLISPPPPLQITSHK